MSLEEFKNTDWVYPDVNSHFLLLERRFCDDWSNEKVYDKTDLKFMRGFPETDVTPVSLVSFGGDKSALVTAIGLQVGWLSSDDGGCIVVDLDSVEVFDAQGILSQSQEGDWVLTDTVFKTESADLILFTYYGCDNHPDTGKIPVTLKPGHYSTSFCTYNGDNDDISLLFIRLKKM